MTDLRHLLLTLATLVILTGCTKTITVTIPPRVDLKAYPVIGVIDFSAQPPELGANATQKFLSHISSAQPGVRLLELGSRQQLLKEVGRSDLDIQAIKALGHKYGVTALLSGTVELSEPHSNVSIGSNLSSISAQTKIDGKMSAKLWETASGATAWSNSSWGNWKVSGISLSERGTLNAVIRTPQEEQDRILMALVRGLNDDFWPTYERREVKD
jgi:hypothetical protein